MIDPLSVRARNGAAEVAQMERELAAAKDVVEKARTLVKAMTTGHVTTFVVEGGKHIPTVAEALKHYDLIKSGDR